MSKASFTMKNDFVIIARDASIDESDRMVSIFKIIDRFSFDTQSPEIKQAIKDGNGVNVPFHCVAATSWSADRILDSKTSLTLQYAIVDPSGGIVTSGEQPTSMSAGTDTLRYNLSIEGFGYKGDGDYLYQFTLIDDNEKQLAQGAARLRVGPRSSRTSA